MSEIALSRDIGAPSTAPSRPEGRGEADARALSGQPRVLVFSDTYLKSNEAFIPEQARHLRRYAPEFLTLHRVRSAIERNYAFPVRCFSDTLAGRLGELAIKAGRVAIPQLIPGLRGASLVHAHFGQNGYVLRPVAAQLGVPLLTTFHGYDATFAGQPGDVPGFYNRRFFARGRRRMAEGGSKCVAVSKYLLNRMLEHGFSRDHVYLHHIGLDLSSFAPRPDVARVPYRIAYVARLEEIKGHRFLLDVVGRLTASGLPVELVLVGKGPLRAEIESLAQGRVQSLTIHDELPREKIAELVASARLYLQTSYTQADGQAENLPISMLEAHASGTPVVAFDTGGVSEGVSGGRSGFVVPEKDTAAMAEAAARLMADDAQWGAFSVRARSFMSEFFDIRRTTAGLEDIYDDVRRARRT